MHSDDDDDAAVAASGPDARRETAHRRDAKPPGDTAPNAASVDAPAWCAQRNDAEHVGNVGWLFGNWWQRPRNCDMREHLEISLTNRKPSHEHRAC